MKTFLLMATAFASLSLMAKTTWTGQGADNKWQTPENWDNGVPKASSSETTSIPEGDWTIEIEGTCEFYILSLAEGSGTVTLKGTGTLRHSSTATGSTKKIAVRAGRELVIDGPVVMPWSYEQDGTVRLNSGSFIVSTKGFPLTGAAQFDVCGGTFQSADGYDISIGANASFRVMDGVAEIDTKAVTVEPGGEFLFLGGTLETLADEVSASAESVFLPAKGAELVAQSEFELNMRSQQDYAFGGTVCATNGGRIAFTGNSDASIPMNVSGRGALNVTKMSYIGAKSGNVVNFDLAELNLGSGGIVPSSHYGNLHFLNGIRIGALADWDTSGSLVSYYHLHGPVEFDTQFHRIDFGSAHLEDLDGLKVSGGGEVALVNVGGSPAHLDTLSVAANTTLTLTNGVAVLKTAKLELGEGAVLTLDINKGQLLDVSVSARFGEGAKIRLVLPAELDPEKLYPVYFAPLGVNPDLSVFELPGDLPSGWYLDKQENSVYLTEGTVHPGTGEPDKNNRYWNGSENGSYANVNNWQNAEIGSGTATIANFSGDRNTIINNDVSNMQTRRMVFAASSGPYVIRGNSFRFMHPTTSDESLNSLCSNSKFPVTIESTVWKKDNTGSFVINAAGTGPVSLVGGDYAAGSVSPLYFSGDVRLGGTWSLADLSAGSAEHACASVLTVLPEANVTVANAASEKSRAASYYVAEGGTCTINGTQLMFTTKENTHFIDGTLAVNCPLVAASKQTFRGTGTLKLAQLGSETGGIELAGEIVCVPGAWAAVTPVYCRDAPTLKPDASTTIDLGEETAIRLEPHAALTVDTTSGDLTLASPVVGGGDVIKTGAGKLVFNCAGSVLDTLTITDGTVEVGEDLIAAAATGYQPFLTVKRLNGELTVKGAKIKVCENRDGTKTYSLRKTSGLFIIFK